MKHLISGIAAAALVLALVSAQSTINGIPGQSVSGDIGVATGTSLALGGCTIGVKAICTTLGIAPGGDVDMSGGSGNVILPQTTSYKWLSRGSVAASADGRFLWRNNAGTDFGRMQFGGTTSSFPAFKRSGTTLAFRLADDSADAPISASDFTASGANVVLSGLGSATGTPNSLCQNGTTVTVNAALTCTVSARDAKLAISPLNVQASKEIMKLSPSQFAYKDAPKRSRWGFIAEDLAAVDKRLGDAYTKEGNPRSIDQNAILALAVRAIQEQQIEIDQLKKTLREKR